MTPRVRTAEERDKPALAGMMQEYYAESKQPLDATAVEDNFGRLLSEPALGTVYVAKIDKVAAGYMVLTQRFSMDRGGSTGTLEDLYVRPAFRRSGVGRALVGAALSDAKARGFLGIAVEVGSMSEPAARLYSAFGLEPGELHVLYKKL